MQHFGVISDVLLKQVVQQTVKLSVIRCAMNLTCRNYNAYEEFSGCIFV